MHAILFFPGRTITQCNNTGLEQVLTQQNTQRAFSLQIHSPLPKILGMFISNKRTSITKTLSRLTEEMEF